MQLITPGLGLVFWMALSFGIVLWLLAKFAWKPILNMLHQREENIEKALKAAEVAREEMQNLQSTHEQLLREAKEERDAILRDARKIKDTILDEARAKASEERERIIESARQSIEYEKMAAITELKNQIANLSIEIAENILREELKDKDKHENFIKKQLDQMTFTN